MSLSSSVRSSITYFPSEAAYNVSDNKSPYKPLVTNDHVTVVYIDCLVHNSTWMAHSHYDRQEKSIKKDVEEIYRIGDLYFKSNISNFKPDVKLIDWKSYRFYVITGKDIQFGISANNYVGSNVFRIKCYSFNEGQIVQSFDRIFFLIKSSKREEEREDVFKKIANDVLKKEIDRFEDVHQNVKEALINIPSVDDEKLKNEMVLALNDEKQKASTSTRKHQTEMVDEMAVKRIRTTNEVQASSQNAKEIERLILENQNLEKMIESYLTFCGNKAKEHETMQAFVRTIHAENEALKPFEIINTTLRQTKAIFDQENSQLGQQINQLDEEINRRQLQGVLMGQLAAENILLAKEIEHLKSIRAANTIK